MNLLKLSAWRRLLRRHSLEANMREEMEFHRQCRVDDLRARGMSEAEARRTAALEFGSLPAYQEECRASLGYRIVDELRSDLSFGLRSLRSNAGYGIAAVVILALAIGVNAAFFSLYAHYVLKPLPIRGAERHFDLFGRDAQARHIGGWTTPEIDAFVQNAPRDVEGLYTIATVQTLLIEPVQRHALVTAVSANYFKLLGAGTASGRTFDSQEQNHPVAVLSRSGQRRLFPDDPSPLGRKIRLRAVMFTVIGVMRESFTGTEPAVPDFWIGQDMRSALRQAIFTNGLPRYNVAGLLRPGTSLQQAESALSPIASRFIRPESERIQRIELEDHTSMFGKSDETNTAAAFVFAAFLAVLLIACANLTNLCLSRAASRTHEIAMRLSLGASRARIVRQLLTESTFIALIGATAGLAFAAFAVDQAERQFTNYAAEHGIAMLAPDIDWRVFAFSAVLGILAGVAFGLLPALEVTAPNLTASTKREQSAFAGRIRPRRMRNALIAGQVTASLVLLILAGVLVRNLQRLNAVDIGYDLDRVYDLKLDPPVASMLRKIEQQPGVVSVTAVARVPLYGAPDRTRIETGNNQSTLVAANFADQNYFRTLALPVEGRGFTEIDTAANAKVAIVSQSTARRLWPNANPIGQWINVPKDDPAETLSGPHQVIGVVPDVVSAWIFQGKDATAIYFPASAGQPAIRSAMIRIEDGEPAAVSARLRELCSSEPGSSGCEPTPLREVSVMQRVPFQIAAGVTAALGFLALALTVVGLYSVTSYTVQQRRREIGVHMALGASPLQVLRRLIREAWRSLAIGAAIGLPICLILSRLAASTVLEIRTFDPVSYTVVPLLLASVATLACAIPARRAAAMDPMRSLREE